MNSFFVSMSQHPVLSVKLGDDIVSSVCIRIFRPGVTYKAAVVIDKLEIQNHDPGLTISSWPSLPARSHTSEVPDQGPASTHFESHPQSAAGWYY